MNELQQTEVVGAVGPHLAEVRHATLPRHIGPVRYHVPSGVQEAFDAIADEEARVTGGASSAAPVGRKCISVPFMKKLRPSIQNSRKPKLWANSSLSPPPLASSFSV